MNLYKQLKSLVPNSLKYPFWFVFKSPQRSLSSSSLSRDLKGIATYCWFRLFPKKKLSRISICTGIYNRTDNYLNQLLESVNKVQHKHLVELSVFDCHSTDTASLLEEIKQRWSGKLVFNKEDISFSRSYSFNQAVDQATSELVFICDADMSLPRNIVTLVNQYTGPKTVWYPIYFFLFRNKPQQVAKGNGFWEQYASKGMFAALKQDFLSIGGLDERFKVWGAEDTELWERFHKNNFVVIRNRQQDFFHHWHHTFNPKFAHLNDAR